MSQSFRYDVLVVGGFGHVGLPFGIMLADSGLQVALYDINTKMRDTIQSGKMPFLEYDAEPLLQKNIGKTLHIADTLEAVKQSKNIVVTIGTPIDEYLNPRTGLLMQLTEEMRPYVGSGQCLILRSTLFPGTSKTIWNYYQRHGCDVDVAYCPERIVQGYAIRELKQIPQVISGFRGSAVTMARGVFETLGVECVEVDVMAAELVKLYSNAWRYIQFATANQFYMIAESHGVAYEEVYRAMTYNYDRAKGFPRPGFAAGPCLLKDTMQLAAFYENQFQLGYAAMTINEGLPNFVARQVEVKTGRELGGMKVGLLGMAFKANTDDIRDSLAYKLRKILSFRGADVLCSDEFVNDESFVSKEELVNNSEVIIVCAPHSAYRELSVPSSVHVEDLWGVLAPSSSR